MSISPNALVFCAQKLPAKAKTMRLLGLFQQAGPFFELCNKPPGSSRFRAQPFLKISQQYVRFAVG
jgi:hypothetical protein